MSFDTPPAIWATETTYPSGPTAGDVCKVQPSGDLVLPGVKTPAEYSNFNFNQWTLAIRSSFGLVAATALSNWSPTVAIASVSSVTGPNNWAGFSYDFAAARWVGCMLSVNTTNRVTLAQSFDGGRTWAGFFTSTSLSGFVPLAMSVGYFGGIGNNPAVAIISGSSTATAHSIVGGVDTTTALAGPASAAVTWSFNTSPTAGNFYTYYINQTSGTFTGHLQGADVTGTTWNAAVTIPAAFASGTNHIGNLFVAKGPNAFTNSFIVAIGGATAGTDTAHIMSCNAAITTCTDITPAFLTGMVITGIAYGAQDGLWGVLCNNGAGGESFLYTSPDLVNWTQVWTTATVSTTYGLQVVGGVWCFVLYNGTSYQLWLSKDLGILGASASWHQSSSYKQAVTNDGQGGFFCNGNQLVSADDTDVAMSLVAGLI
jgi:hypothetical protein